MVKKSREFILWLIRQKLISKPARVGLDEAKSISYCACGSSGLPLQVFITIYPVSMIAQNKYFNSSKSR